MKLADVIRHYGSKMAACDSLGITRQAGTKWGYWMHRETAQKIEALTMGAVCFDYSANESIVDGVTYTPATDVDRAYRATKFINEIFYFINGEMIKASDSTEALKFFRKFPPYRKG